MGLVIVLLSLLVQPITNNPSAYELQLHTALIALENLVHFYLQLLDFLNS